MGGALFCFSDCVAIELTDGLAIYFFDLSGIRADN